MWFLHAGREEAGQRIISGQVSAGYLCMLDPDNRASEGRTQAHLADMYSAEGQLDRSLALYDEAIKITRELGGKHNEAIF